MTPPRSPRSRARPVSAWSLSGGSEGLSRDEFVHGVPYANFVNAAFAYWKPREPNRFNATRGAWYAALEVETCMREVAYHMAEFLARSGVMKGVVDTRKCSPAWRGSSLTPRRTGHPCLDPDPAKGYPIGNALADAALAQGLNGLIYPSVGPGTCIVALRPYAVQSVAPGAVYRFKMDRERGADDRAHVPGQRPAPCARAVDSRPATAEAATSPAGTACRVAHSSSSNSSASNPCIDGLRLVGARFRTLDVGVRCA